MKVIKRVRAVEPAVSFTAVCYSGGSTDRRSTLYLRDRRFPKWAWDAYNVSVPWYHRVTYVADLSHDLDQPGPELAEALYGYQPDGGPKLAEVWRRVARGWPEHELSGLVVNLAGPIAYFQKPGITKSAGLARLCRKAGVSASEAAVFGNGGNDLDMLRWAGTAVAMADSPAEVLTVANIVAPAGASADGVAIVLERWTPAGSAAL